MSMYEVKSSIKASDSPTGHTKYSMCCRNCYVFYVILRDIALYIYSMKTTNVHLCEHQTITINLSLTQDVLKDWWTVLEVITLNFPFNSHIITSNS